MDVIETIRARKTIRGYKPDPVPKEVFEEILDTARHTPSAYNTQPWEITVVTGEVLQNIKQGNTEVETSGVEPDPDVPRNPYYGIFKQRRIDVAKQVFAIMGIAREDKEKRAQWQYLSSRFFHAPAALIVSIDRSLEGQLTLMDIGGFLQTVCLAAWNYGLGTCVDFRAVFFPKVVRKFTGIPDSKRILIAIAIGYPDWDSTANELDTPREPFESFTTWCGFD
ncbi:nitroreductase [Chloroflexota bacterium]